MTSPVYPASAFLHPQRRESRDQDGTLMCVHYAVSGGMTTLALRAGFDHVYSPSYLGQMGKAMLGLSGDHGIRFDQQAANIERNGMALDSEFNGYHNWALQPSDAVIEKARARRPIRLRPVKWINDDPVETVKHYVCQGRSVIFSMLAPPGYRQSVQYVDWRKQVVAVSSSVFEHAMECDGYDDACQRVHCTNSGGSSFSEAGLEYKNLRGGPDRIVYQMWVIDQDIYPLKKVEGYMPGTAQLTLAEMGPVVMLKRAELKAAEEVATQQFRAEMIERLFKHQPANATGWQWLIDALVEEKRSARIGDICAGQREGWLLETAKSLGLDVSKLDKDD